MKKIPIVVFASGRGSNFLAIYDAITQNQLNAEIVGVFSDQTDAPVLAKARQFGLKTFSIPVPPASAQLPNYERRREHEKRILNEILPLHPKFLVLAGYMRIITSSLIEAFRSERGFSRIVNIHPSILPSSW